MHHHHNHHLLHHHNHFAEDGEADDDDDDGVASRQLSAKEGSGVTVEHVGQYVAHSAP